MKKLLVIFLIISLVDIGLYVHAAQQFFITKQWITKHKYFSIPVKTNKSLYTVAWGENNIIYVQPVSSYSKPCEIHVNIDTSIPSFKFLRGIRVKTLGNGNIIVNIHQEIKDSRSFANIFVIIDPLICDGRTQMYPNSGVEYVIFNYDTFDLIPALRKSSYLRRIKATGEVTLVNYALDPSINLLDSSCFVPVKPEDLSKGYFIITQVSNKMILSLLDEKFKLVKQTHRIGRAMSCSTDFGAISTCYVEGNRGICEFLDENLNYKVKVPMYQAEGYLKFVWISNLENGNAVVLMQHNVQNGFETFDVARVQRINKNGTTSEIMGVGILKDINNLLFGTSMNNDEYCIISVQREILSEYITSPIIVNTTCISTM